MEHCPNCGGKLKIIAAILESAVIERNLTHLGLQADCGRMTAPARGHTPQEGLALASASAARGVGRRRGLRRVSVRWRKPPDRGSTVPAPSAQHLGTMGPAAPGAFQDRQTRHGPSGSPVFDPADGPSQRLLRR